MLSSCVCLVKLLSQGYSQTPLATVLACALCLAHQTLRLLSLNSLQNYFSPVLASRIVFDLSNSSTHQSTQCLSPSCMTLQTPITSTHHYSYYPVSPLPYQLLSTLPTPSHFTIYHFLMDRQVSVIVSHLCIFIHFHLFPSAIGTVINPVPNNLLSHRQPFNQAPTLS